MISVRYADGGGLTAAQREKRERLRLEAAEMFAAGIEPPQVALRLWVSRSSAYRWRRAWDSGGTGALASKGPSGSRRRLSARQLQRLAAASEAGPALYGWAQDQTPQPPAAAQQPGAANRTGFGQASVRAPQFIHGHFALVHVVKPSASRSIVCIPVHR